MLARLTHDFSPRREGPFVPVNCPALPEELAEFVVWAREKDHSLALPEILRVFSDRHIEAPFF